MEPTEPRQHLIAMIDGDNAKFALAQGADSLQLTRSWTTRTDQFPTFIDALQHFLKTNDLDPRDYSVAIAVAGVTRGDIVNVAHCRWYITLSGLRSFLRSEPMVINELAATAWALTVLGSGHMQAIGAHRPAKIVAGGTYVVIGAGVGLGLAALHVAKNGETIVLESEGGHGSFAPQDEMDDFILSQLRQQFGHVSYERIISEGGFQNICSALAAQQGLPQSERPLPGLPAAGTREDPMASEASRIMIRSLASFVGSMTLSLGAWDGVFLTGGLLGGLMPAIRRFDFAGQFSAKGRLRKSLTQVPIAFVDHPDTSLLGAAAALNARRT